MRFAFTRAIRAAASTAIPLLDWSADTTTTRALEATHWDGSTFLVAGVDTARVLADGTLYVEGSRRNEHPVHNGGMSAVSASISSNILSAPDGTTTADRFTASGAEGRVYRLGMNVSSAGQYACSAWHRYNSGDAGGSLYVVDGPIPSTSQSFTPIAGTWTRVSVRATASGGGLTSMGIVEVGANNNASVYYWGMQLERGDFPSQLIRTTSVAVTRPSDDVIVASGTVPSAMKSGRWRVTVQPARASTEAADAATETLFAFGTGTDNRIHIDGSDRIVVRQGGSDRVTTGALTWSRGQSITLTFNASSGSVTVSGATTGNGTTSGTSWTMPTGDLQVGNDSALATPFFGAIGRPLSA